MLFAFELGICEIQNPLPRYLDPRIIKQLVLEILAFTAQERTFPVLFAANKYLLENSNERPRNVRQKEEPKVKLNKKETELNVKQLSPVKDKVQTLYKFLLS